VADAEHRAREATRGVPGTMGATLEKAKDVAQGDSEWATQMEARQEIRSEVRPPWRLRARNRPPAASPKELRARRLRLGMGR
jgi:hypothetical protein